MEGRIYRSGPRRSVSPARSTRLRVFRKKCVAVIWSSMRRNRARPSRLWSSFTTKPFLKFERLPEGPIWRAHPARFPLVSPGATCDFGSKGKGLFQSGLACDRKGFEAVAADSIGKKAAAFLRNTIQSHAGRSALFSRRRSRRRPVAEPWTGRRMGDDVGGYRARGTPGCR